MERDYTQWNQLQTRLNQRQFAGNFSEREVWWCSLGVNIGDEEDGKNRLCERPVLVVKKFSKRLFFGIPLSTTQKESQFYHPIAVGDRDGVVILSQGRVLAGNRLQRRIGRVTQLEYDSILKSYLTLTAPTMIKKSDSHVTESPRAPSGDLYLYNTENKPKSQGETT